MSVADATEKLGILLCPPRRTALLLRAARLLFARSLGVNRAAREFLERRGIHPGTAREFRLGATLPPGELVRKLRSRGFTVEEMCEAGLLGKTARGYREQLAGRLVIPLTSPGGYVLGFAGRALEEDRLPKYLNTAISPLGGRSSTLFGLPQAAPHIRERGEAWVVEGYFDVMACWQAGIRWAVAPCGVALSARQAVILRRYASRAVILYDGDAATDVLARASRNLRKAGINVFVSRLPAGMDPDEVILQEGPMALMDIASCVEVLS
jgi:DNA primase